MDYKDVVERYAVPMYETRLVHDARWQLTASSLDVRDPTRAVDVFKLFMPTFADERLYVMTLDCRNQMIGITMVASGTPFATLFEPMQIFRPAILQNASGIIMCHNHPSGIAIPSRDDIVVTNELRVIGFVLGIEVIDHIIIGSNGTWSNSFGAPFDEHLAKASFSKAVKAAAKLKSDYA